MPLEFYRPPMLLYSISTPPILKETDRPTEWTGTSPVSPRWDELWTHELWRINYIVPQERKDSTAASHRSGFSLSIIHAIILTCGLWAVCLFVASLAATLTSKAIQWMRRRSHYDPASACTALLVYWLQCRQGRSLISFPSLFIHTLRCVLSLPRVPACFTLVPLSSSQLVAR